MLASIMRRIILATTLALALASGASAQSSSNGNKSGRDGWAALRSWILSLFDREPTKQTTSGKVVEMPEPGVISELVIAGAGVAFLMTYRRRKAEQQQ
jgi:hypothetical protein